MFMSQNYYLVLHDYLINIREKLSLSRHSVCRKFLCHSVYFIFKLYTYDTIIASGLCASLTQVEKSDSELNTPEKYKPDLTTSLFC